MIRYVQPSLSQEYGLVWEKWGIFALKICRNRVAGLYHFTQAAAYNRPESQFSKALIHKEDQNYEESFLWMRKAANNRHSEAAYHLGAFYEKGIGTNINLARAEKCYMFAGQNKNFFAVAALALGHLLFDQGRYKEALEYFEYIPDSDNEHVLYARFLRILLNPAPQKKVVFCDEIEQKTPQQRTSQRGILRGPSEIDKIMACFRELAKNGDTKASYCVGLLHRVNSQTAKAVPCFLRSAKQGYAPAQIECGNLALKTSQFGKALFFFKSAAIQGYPHAIFNMAVTYGNWLSHPKTKVLTQAVQENGFEKMKFLYTKAADLDFLPAIHELGMILYHEDKIVEAVRYLSLAAENDFDASVGNLGLILYSQGHYERALAYLVKAAEQHNHQAQYYAGLVYGLHMPNTQSNFKSAQYYLTLALEGGIEEAKDGRIRVFERKAEAPNTPVDSDYDVFIYPPIEFGDQTEGTEFKSEEESKNSEMAADGLIV